MLITRVAAAGSWIFNTWRSWGSKTQTMAVHEKRLSSSASVPTEVYPALVGGRGVCDNCVLARQLFRVVTGSTSHSAGLWFVCFPNDTQFVNMYWVCCWAPAYRWGLQRKWIQSLSAGHTIWWEDGCGVEESAVYRESYCTRRQYPESVAQGRASLSLSGWVQSR